METFKQKKYKKICIVANDAGGAEILKSFIFFSNSQFSYILTGPAKKIFKKKNKSSNYKKIINDSDIVITGTSYKSLTEYKCIKYCKKINKKVFSILDHWVNYKIRFVRNNKFILPDKLIVCDKESKKIASKYFNNILYMPNPYWKYIKKKFKNKKNNIKSKKFLYVSSNYNRTKKKYKDKWILQKLIKYLEKKNNTLNLVIRPHPSENKNKFKNFFSEKIKISIDKNKSLVNSLRKTSIVFGHNSMAMVMGKICGLKTVNININGQKNYIPRKYIDRFI